MVKEIFEKQVERETYEPINIELLEKKSQSHSYLGYLQGKLTIARREENFELIALLEKEINVYKRFYSKIRIPLKSWKGKSDIQVIEKPDGFDIITFQKKDQESIPKEIRRNIPKEEVNLVITAIKSLDTDKQLRTRDIAREYCLLSGLKENGDNKPLFDFEGFNWNEFFADRFLHTQLNITLRLLDYYNLIHYRAGKTKVLKKFLSVKGTLK